MRGFGFRRGRFFGNLRKFGRRGQIGRFRLGIVLIRYFFRGRVKKRNNTGRFQMRRIRQFHRFFHGFFRRRLHKILHKRRLLLQDRFFGPGVHCSGVRRNAVRYSAVRFLIFHCRRVCFAGRGLRYGRGKALIPPSKRRSFAGKENNTDQGRGKKPFHGRRSIIPSTTAPIISS
jgi:hypothetical protein